MNSQQLTVFYEVMKTGSVSQAARNLLRTQPAVSSTIKGLETELGVSLFRREGRRMIPVPEAQYLMEEAREILSRLDLTRQNLVNMRNLQRGTIRVVAMPGPSAYLLPEFVSNFVADRPEVQVSMQMRSSPQVRSLLATTHYDVGFCDMTRFGKGPRHYHSEELPSRCICAVPVNHRLSQHKFLTPEDLDGEPMGALQPDHTTYIDTLHAFTQSNVQFRLVYDTQYFLPLFHFIEKGHACAIVDVLSAETYLRSHKGREAIKFIPFEPRITFGYSILTSLERPLSKLAQSFADDWRDFVAGVLAKFQDESEDQNGLS